MTIPIFHHARRWSALSMAALLSACASLSSDGDGQALQDLTQGRLSGHAWQNPQEPSAQTKVADLLRQPLTQSSAVQIALLNNPAMHAALARLGVSDAERVLASSWPAPHLSLARLREGDVREIDRGIGFNLLGLLTLPWQAQVQSQQHELRRLQTAQEIVRLAANTRKAWVQAVAAEQSARYMADALEAAQASAELARRMRKAGHWSALQQSREQLLLTDVQAQHKRAQHLALIEREALVRLLGLSAAQTAFQLPSRLPDLPTQAMLPADAQAQALRERLDVRSALHSARQMADASGISEWQAWAQGMELGYMRNTSHNRATGDKEVQRGWELSVPLPVFTAQARDARAQALMQESAARVRETSLVATSEVRAAFSAYRTAFDIARQYRDEVLPLRRQVSEEVLLRYNGMLLGVFDVLADARNQIATVNAALAAERDFWLAKTDLDTALTGTSPQGLAALQASASSAPTNEQGH
jgi:outer membrane protein, multidrug efflux system